MLSTQRLIIRPFHKNDYQDLYEYLSLKETYQYEPGEPISLEEAKKDPQFKADIKKFIKATTNVYEL